MSTDTELTANQIIKRAERILRYFNAGFYQDFLYASRAKRYASLAASYASSGDLYKARTFIMQAEEAWKTAKGKAL